MATGDVYIQMTSRLLASPSRSAIKKALFHIQALVPSLLVLLNLANALECGKPLRVCNRMEGLGIATHTEHIPSTHSNAVRISLHQHADLMLLDT